MGLCLHVFSGELSEDDEPEEIAECDLGPYSYFAHFRESIGRNLGAQRFPTLMGHSDCDGEWSLEELPALERELREIATEFRGLPIDAARDALGYLSENPHGPPSLYDCFHNTSGENLFEALLELCRIARMHRQPITFM